MKLLFVDDNRDVLNWGCRATSMALYSLLSSKFTVFATIGKRTVDEQIPLGLFAFQNKHLGKGRYNKYFRFISKAVIHRSSRVNKTLPKLLGFKGFLVNENPTQSVESLMHYKKYFEELEQLYQKVKDADVVAINGEGSMIFTTPPRKDLLFQLMIIELAKQLDKPVFYLNAMVSDCPSSGRNKDIYHTSLEMLQKCNGVTVRDSVSLSILEEGKSKINAKFIPDALFSWYDYYNKNKLDDLFPKDLNLLIPHPEYQEHINRWDFSKPYICISDGSVPLKDSSQKNENAFIALVEKLKNINLLLYLINTGGSNFINNVSVETGVPVIPGNINIFAGGAILANAEVFISGRFHPSILASLGGTPCIFMGSNSHKTYSLQKVLSYQDYEVFPINPSEDETDAIVLKAQELIDDNSKRRVIKKTVKKLGMETSKIAEFINQCI